ncbi:hypothetical protein [uncultured Sunxiuqinia sp.]|uniref:hypothetical protein n=1 Tax=uncultured Sunxiuqinia sp. TaxID=1573825 RepID=UPI00262CE627|nr:hypothetical protein [uncultured Sunxiuqinia sp.]
MQATAPKTDVEPQPPVKVPTKRRIKRHGSGYTPSIKDALSGKMTEEGEEDATEKLKYYTGEQLEEHFTEEQFKVKWQEYLLKLEDRPNLKATLSRPIKINKDYKLNLPIDNSVQLEEINKIKPDLVSWLRRELRNTRIELITDIVVQETEYKPYSETEKLAEMVKKNPTLALLKQRFNLDFGE